MTAIFGSILSDVIGMIILGAAAVAGIICGRKFRDWKNAKKAAQEPKD